MGRLVREILRITDPRTTFYAEQRNTWYDVRTKPPSAVIDILLFRKLHRAVGSFGLSGLDRLLSFMIVKELQLLTGSIQSIFVHKESSDMLDSFMRQLTPLDGTVGKRRYLKNEEKKKKLIELDFSASQRNLYSCNNQRTICLGNIEWLCIESGSNAIASTTNCS